MQERFYEKIGERVYSRTLANGLPVRVIHKPHYAHKYAFFVTRYGGMDMRFQLDGAWQDTPAGIAHFLEHKMFDTEEGNALQELAKNGAEPNAFTSNAITAYHFDSTDHFMENLGILLRFVSIPYFTEESVQKEQGIIGQEIRMIEDTPDWQTYTHLMQCLYHRSPARVSVAGTIESISHISAQTLYDCHKAFYTPANMALCVVGDVDPEAVAALAEEILPKASGPAIDRDYGEETDLCPAERERVLHMEVALPMLMAGYKCAPIQAGPERMRQGLLGDLACDILFGDSSPLYTRLYEEGKLNGGGGAGFDILPGAAYLYVSAETDYPKEVHAAVTAEAKRLVEEGIDEDYYQRIRRSIYGNLIRGLNSFENISANIADGCFHGYDYFTFPEVFASITKADVEAFLRENITEERTAAVLLYPKEGT